MQISTWVSSQKLRLISAAVRVNQQFLCCWRLRNQHELDAVVEELSALLPKEQLYQLYEQATREPYSFLFVYYLLQAVHECTPCKNSFFARFCATKRHSYRLYIYPRRISFAVRVKMRVYKQAWR